MTEESCGKLGLDGEKTCYQFMKDRWETESKKYLGYVAPLNEENAKYVAVHVFESALRSGKSDSDMWYVWQHPGTTKCSKGKNKNGHYYDSCDYQKRFEKALAEVKSLEDKEVLAKL